MERYQVLKDKLEAQQGGVNSKDPFVKAMKEGEAKDLLDSRTSADAAALAIQNLESVRELRKRPVATGPLGQYVTKGLDVVGLGGGQALTGAGNKIWIDTVSQLKGALSNQEGARLDGGNPGDLAMNDPEAKVAIDLGVAAAQRQQQKSAFLEAYYANNNTLEGSREAWRRYVEERPLLYVDKKGKETILQQNIGGWESFAARNPNLVPTGARRPPPDSVTGGDVPQIRTVEEYNALPKGAPYIDPNGKPKVKQ
jgi:hypothetical protein